MPTIIAPTFDRNDSKYKCLCNSVHATTAVKILFVLRCLSVVSDFFSIFFFGVIYIFGIFMDGALAACLYMAQRTEKAAWLLPELILRIIAIVCVFISALACLVVGLAFNSAYEDWVRDAELTKEQRELYESINIAVVGIVLAVVLVLAGLINIWLCLVVKSAYEFYRDQEHHRLSVSAQSGYLQQVQPQTGYPPQPQTGYGQPQTGYGQPQIGYGQPQTGYPQQAGYYPEAK